MKYRLILFIILCLPFFANAGVCEATEHEDFLSFFFRFSGSKNFASDRTVYPLKVVTQVYGIDETGNDLSVSGVSYRSKQQDADLSSLANLLQEENMIAKVHEISAKAFVVQIFGNDPDQGETLHFSLNGNCWFLKESRKHSLSNQHWVIQQEKAPKSPLVPHFYAKPDNQQLRAMLRVLNHLSLVRDDVSLGDIDEAMTELSYLIDNLEARNNYAIEGREQVARQLREALSSFNNDAIIQGSIILGNVGRTLWGKID